MVGEKGTGTELLVCWGSLQLGSGLKRSEKKECRWGHKEGGRERRKQGEGSWPRARECLVIGMTLGIISAPDQLIYLQEEVGRLAVILAPLLRVTASSFLDGPAPAAATGQERADGCRWHGSADGVGGATPKGFSHPRARPPVVRLLPAEPPGLRE